MLFSHSGVCVCALQFHPYFCQMQTGVVFVHIFSSSLQPMGGEGILIIILVCHRNGHVHTTLLAPWQVTVPAIMLFLL